MKIDPTIVCTIEPPERQDFGPEAGEMLGFVKHPTHGVLLVDYKILSNGRYFAHFLEKPGVGMWVTLPRDTRVLRLTKATFREVTP